MLPHRRCASMPALPLWVCIDVSPPTVLHCRCAAMLALPRCPTVAVKSVFKIHALLLRYMHLDLPHGASELAAPVQFGPKPQPSSARAAGPGPSLGFGWAGVGGLAGGVGPGVRAAPDARPAGRPTVAMRVAAHCGHGHGADSRIMHHGRIRTRAGPASALPRGNPRGQWR